jgi:hypothetical protein
MEQVPGHTQISSRSHKKQVPGHNKNKFPVTYKNKLPVTAKIEKKWFPGRSPGRPPSTPLGTLLGTPPGTLSMGGVCSILKQYQRLDNLGIPLINEMEGG